VLSLRVIVGVVETAVKLAHQHMVRQRDTLRAYERVEWSKAEIEGWLIEQAYDGMLRAVEEGNEGRPGRRRRKRLSQNWRNLPQDGFVG
jgi:hypothetical protein